MKAKLLIPILMPAILVLNCRNVENTQAPSSSETEAELPVVVAHRGGAHLAPENTLAAIRQAVELGVDMIEIDVILSNDGEVIVIHDDTIDRTTDGEGVVKEMTLEEIKQYDAGSWFDARFAGEQVPTLGEVFEAIDGLSILLIEIKDGDEQYPGLERKVVDEIKSHDAADWVVVQSFNEKSVLRVKEMVPALTTYYLLGGNFPEFYEALESPAGDLPYDGLAVHHSVIDAAKVTKIHEIGYLLFTWTVNEDEDMQRIIAAGVDGIITDRPDRLQEMLGE